MEHEVVVITRQEWEKKLQSIIVRKEFMNKMVMNFMETQGHVDAAVTFGEESGTKQDITTRLTIKKAVELGAVQDAIDKAVLSYPAIFESDIHLLFHLQQQQFIELIRQQEVEQALEIAQGELAPLAGEEEYADLQEELERTVSLLAFENPNNSPYAELLDIKQRFRTARELNEAILINIGQEGDSWVSLLCKCIDWVQHLLNEEAEYPRILDPTTASLVDPLIDPAV